MVKKMVFLEPILYQMWFMMYAYVALDLWLSYANGYVGAILMPVVW